MLTPAQQDRVWDYMERAWEADKASVGAKWARKALAIDPDQLDGYVLLARASDVKAEQIALLSEGVRRGKRVWADEIKRSAQSDFWLDIDTRPFMRNVHWLALLQWESGEREDATQNAEFLLRLNPNDNQGIRYLLLNWYPILDQWEAQGKLFKKYKDDIGPDYLYARCLNMFKFGQDTNSALAEAVRANPYVPAYLADQGLEPPDDEIVYSGYLRSGSEGEAKASADAAREAWAKVDGALKWLIESATRNGAL
jgi:hypothetical protein